MSYGCGQDQTTPSDTHTRSVMLTQFLGSLIQNFILDGSFISFEWLKQLPVAMAMARPHPYLVNYAYLGTWRPHAKILPDWSLLNF